MRHRLARLAALFVLLMTVASVQADERKLNIAVDGAWGGQKGIDDEIFPQKMLIDYVCGYSP